MCTEGLRRRFLLQLHTFHVAKRLNVCNLLSLHSILIIPLNYQNHEKLVLNSFLNYVPNSTDSNTLHNFRRIALLTIEQIGQELTDLLQFVSRRYISASWLCCLLVWLSNVCTLSICSSSSSSSSSSINSRINSNSSYTLSSTFTARRALVCLLSSPALLIPTHTQLSTVVSLPYSLSRAFTPRSPNEEPYLQLCTDSLYPGQGQRCLSNGKRKVHRTKRRIEI